MEFPHSIKEKVSIQDDEFPVITICLNSMHSRRKVDVYFPELGIKKRNEQEKAWSPYDIDHTLTRQFPTVSYALVLASTKLPHFGFSEEIARDWEIEECRG